MFVDSPMTQPCCALQEEQEQEPSRFQPDAQTWTSTLPSSSLVTEQELRGASLNGPVQLRRGGAASWAQAWTCLDDAAKWLRENRKLSKDGFCISSTRCK